VIVMTCRTLLDIYAQATDELGRHFSYGADESQNGRDSGLTDRRGMGAGVDLSGSTDAGRSTSENIEWG
jgi:hypothetical protein